MKAIMQPISGREKKKKKRNMRQTKHIYRNSPLKKIAYKKLRENLKDYYYSCSLYKRH